MAVPRWLGVVVVTDVAGWIITDAALRPPHPDLEFLVVTNGRIADLSAED
jgi:hypothetical protein